MAEERRQALKIMGAVGVSSLNVSVAAGVMLFEWKRRAK